MPINQRMTDDFGWHVDVRQDGDRATMIGEYMRTGKTARVGPVFFNGAYWVVDVFQYDNCERVRHRGYFSCPRAALWTCCLMTARVEIVE